MRRLRRDVEHHRLRSEPSARKRRQHSKRHRGGIVAHELGFDSELEIHLFLDGSDPYGAKPRLEGTQRLRDVARHPALVVGRAARDRVERREAPGQDSIA